MPHEPLSPARITVAAVALCLMLPLVDANLLAGWRWGGVLATPLLAIYLAMCWPRIMLSAQLLLLLCVGLGAFVFVQPGGPDTLVSALGRMTFLPAFVATLGLLRAAADSSHTVARAGHVLVSQPPSRRYAALTLGGQIFGVLLNIGGLALLLDMTRRANTLEAGRGDARVVAVRQRRITLAILRGFSTIPFWSPLGLALNLLLAAMPDVAWSEVAPWGFLASLVFMGLGFLFDRLGNPPSQRPPAPRAAPGGGWAVAAMAGHILLLCSLTMAAELATHWSFQAVLVNIVPLYAGGWLLATGARRPEGAWAFAGTALREKGVAHWPSYANEIAVFAASGFLGVVLSDLVPRDALQAVVQAMELPPGVFAAGLAVTVMVTGFVGVHPMITGAILAGTFSSVAVPGLSHAEIVLALAGGWVCVTGLGPMTSTLVLASAAVGRSPRELGLVWNGRFSVTALAIWLVALQFIDL